jgi:AcrR family transcriptional regulator
MRRRAADSPFADQQAVLDLCRYLCHRFNDGELLELLVRKAAQPTRRLVYEFDKPAKERIIDASDRLFRIGGIRVGALSIAEEAHSNVETFRKYFQSGISLVRRYVGELIKECENDWREMEREHPNDPEAQLRYWIFWEQGHAEDIFSSQVLLSRTSAELHPKDPLLADILRYRQNERLQIMNLCEAAGFKMPNDLGDKLLLLVQGARIERGTFGTSPPSRLLCQLADDLLEAHGWSRKPPLTIDDWGTC